MKKNLHPNYQPTVFVDTQSGFKFITRSTVQSNEKIKWQDDKEYPLVKVEISSTSHPHYTGKKVFVDTAGRVEKFRKRYAQKSTVKK